MKRRTLLQQAGIALAVAALWAGSAAAQTILKFSHTDQPGGARQKAAELFGQKIEQYTQGRYKLQVYPAGQLANDPKGVEQLQLGGIDFTVSGTGTYATHIPTLNLTLLPFIVETYAQGWKLYDESKWLQAQFAKGPEKGFRFLSTFEAGFRSMTTKDPIRVPADAKGKKLRTFPNEMMRWLLEDMGFGVVIMPLPEVYLAIQQGAVSGQENPIDTIHANKFYEVAPNVTLTQHVYSPIPLTISEKTWQKLSPADREAITRAAKEAADWSRKEVSGNDDRQLKEMESKGAKIGRPDLAPFRVAVAPTYAKAKEKYGADVETMLAEAEAVRKALPR
ncbi:MAG: TRAP transporter substrate-binding protein [Betaproteobacteria bacterium]|nr:TRAP transporter substrate-binding protein [Betaproteobacteria bacterium]